MKVNPRLLALMAALAVGSAAAAGMAPHGTVISNTATASFEDPANPGTSATPVTSNPVTTTVQPKPDFDITYAGAPSSDGTTPTGTTQKPLPGSHDRQNIVPGATVTTQYVILNNGNVGSNTPNGAAYNVTVTPSYGGTTVPTGTVVQYYVNGQKVYDSGDTATYPGLVSVPADDPTTPADEGQVTLEQRVLVPGTAPSTADFSVTPRGRADVYGAGTVAATDESAGDLQYTRVRLAQPKLDVGEPTKDPGDPTKPIPSVVTPPTTATGTPDPNFDPNNPGNPVNPVTPPGTPTGTGDPQVPGYLDPGNPGTPSQPGTPIATLGDLQIAYPPADGDANADRVTFYNTLTNVGMADTVNLFPTDGTGAPIGTNNNDGSFTLPGGVTVKFLKADGSAITTFYTDASGNKYPTVALPDGQTTPQSVNIRVEVTSPDSNPATTSNPEPIEIVVGLDSGNDSGVVADGTSTDRILPAAMEFGDSKQGAGTDNGAATATQTVNPLVAPATATTTAQNTTDRRAVFPMDLVNRGEYADSYTLGKATLSFPNTAGGTSTADLRYVDANGTELPKDSGGNYISPVVASDDELTVYAVVDVPADALAGTVTVSQTATGNFSTVSSTDPDDKIVIRVVDTASGSSGVVVDKYQTVNGAAPSGVAAEQTPRTALPGDTIRYAIIAKNNFNSPVKNFVLSDSAGGGNNAYTYTTLVSASATASFGTVFYNVNGAGWSTQAPAAGTVITTLQVAVDSDSSNSITAADVVPALGSVRLDLEVTVK